MAKQQPIERIIVCDKCNQHLWRFKILSYFTGKNADDAKLGSTHWESANEFVDSMQPGSSFDCPLCKKEFVWRHKDGAAMIRQIDPINGKKESHWI